MNNTGRKKLAVAGVILVAIIGAWLILKGPSAPLEIIRTTPGNGATINPNQRDVTFTFSEEIKTEPKPFSVVVPHANYQVEIKGRDVIFRFQNDFQDRSAYNIVLENIVGVSGAKLDITALTFTVNDTSPLGAFKRSLPRDSDRFSLRHHENNEFYVIVRARDFNGVKASIEEIFRSAGLNPADYTINYDTNTSAFSGGEPLPYEYDVIEDGPEEDHERDH